MPTILLLAATLSLQGQAPQPFQEQAAALPQARRWPELRALSEAALAAHPGDALGQTYLALVNLVEGRGMEATPLAEAATKAEPLRPLSWWVLGLAHLQAGRTPEAIDAGRRLGELDANLAFEFFGKPALVQAMGGGTELPFEVRSALKPVVQPPAPPYPSKAKVLGVQGDVVLDLLIDGEGNPLVVNPVWGPPELVPTAVAYLKTWRFPQRSGPLRLRYVMDFVLLINPKPYQKAPKSLLQLP